MHAMGAPRRAAVSTAIAASVLALAPAAGASWKHFASPSTAAGGDALPVKAALRRAERAFRTQPGRAGERDVSPLLHRLARGLPELHGAARRRAAGLLARPTDGAADPQQNGWSTPEAGSSPFCSAHFCVHWTDTGNDAPDLSDGNGNGTPDSVETVLATAEHVYSVENAQLGWRPPKGDGALGGGQDLIDIYLSDVGGSHIYGYAAPDPQPESNSVFAFLVLDDDFSPEQFPGYQSPLDPLDVTLAHEYNHVLQFNLDAFEQTWMLESTAVWMEGKVYEPVHDYFQYLPGWVALTVQPLTSFDGNDPNDRTNVKVYGSSVWNKWLDVRYGQDVVRAAWEDSVPARSFAPAAYDTAIRQHGGPGFAPEFDAFAAATAEWQLPNSGFPDGERYPEVERVGTLDVNGAPGTIDLDHTAFALVDVPVTAAPRIRLAVAVPGGTASSLALIGRSGDGLVKAERVLARGGHGVVTLANPGDLSRLTAVLVNSDVTHGSFSAALQDYRFRRDGQHFYAHASTDFTAPRLKRRTGSARKVTVRFSERVLGVTRRSLRVSGASGRVKFKPGSRTATFVSRRALSRGRHRLRLSRAITDLTLNRLHAVTVGFTVR